MPLDLILRGGSVYDGSGADPVRIDVGIAGERIALMGDLCKAEARKTVDATGHIVCPGFIDTHSHSDAFVLADPTAPSKLFQGVTTEVVGQCGISAAPRHGKARLPSDWESMAYPGEWRSVADYRALVDRVRPLSNVILLIGHNLLRAGVAGYGSQPLTPDEQREMEKRLAEGMEEGGWGLSTGLVYPPGRFAPPEEIRSLARVAARHGGVYASHMRSEGVGLLAALDETLDIGRAAGLPIIVSHLKTSGPEAWPLLPAALEKIESARTEGVPVYADRYPYTAGCTDLDILMPAWAMEGSRDEILARLKDPALRMRIRNEIEAGREPESWHRVWVGSTERKEFLGQPLTTVAQTLKTGPVDAALQLIEEDRLSTGGIFFGMSEANMNRILALPWVMIGSDASLRSPEGALHFDHPHPRAYGTFPRLLRKSLEGEGAPIGEMIRKMTSLPARVFGLKDRGSLKPGAFADLVAFDPNRIRDRATYEAPHQLAEGLKTVLVNGTVELLDGRPSGARAGRFLARKE
ncbi:MAG: D-aminoacylase [Kiritimatiellia bacterium]|nr:D-aminoacylase [Kiritimatiellia bacterium]